MDKWEYLAEDHDDDETLSFVEWLNEFGAAGWEIVETDEWEDSKGVWVLFKRRMA